MTPEPIDNGADRLPQRELQALREVGRTRVGRVTAPVLALLFLVTLATVPLARPWAGAGEPVLAPFRELGGVVGGLIGGWRGDGLLAANRDLIGGLRRFEDRLEEASWPRRRLLPPLQLALTARVGLGNEQAYPGADGWLFYRPDLEHVTGPGFLEPAVLVRRGRGGRAWEGAPQPDPVPALEEFAGQLAARGVRLIVLPAPVKPSIRPEPLDRHRRARPPVGNPSFAQFRRRLERAGIAVVDPGPALATLEGDRYLRTDTHWRPEAVERTAELLAATLEPLLESAPVDPGYRRRSVVAEGVGDIATMLRLPAGQGLFPAETVTLQAVFDAAGRPWRSEPSASVLLLGDSFANVYSDPRLGWGRAAGLAEQLAFRLARPVDKLALNAGGPYAARQALARALTADPERLRGKEVVVYQFATRELSGGDWRPVALPGPEGTGGRGGR